nr:hypothetical protein [Tanacetum cinerariifolium]
IRTKGAFGLTGKCIGEYLVGPTSLPVETIVAGGPAVGMEPLPVKTLVSPARTVAASIEIKTLAVTTDVPEVYMHQFWDLVYKHDTFYRFKIDKKKRFKLTLEIFRDIFKIFPLVQGQDFDALPIDDEIVSFLKELGHTREINSLNDVVVDHMHQPWRAFTALINKGLSGNTTGLDKLCLSIAQILWGMYYQKNVDYFELLWKDFI